MRRPLQPDALHHRRGDCDRRRQRVRRQPDASAPTSDPDGPPLQVGAVNGSPANVGVQIMLASGALLTLNANGTFDYDPNGAFDHLPGPLSGASNLSAPDSFTYALVGGTRPRPGDDQRHRRRFGRRHPARHARRRLARRRHRRRHDDRLRRQRHLFHRQCRRHRRRGRRRGQRHDPHQHQLYAGRGAQHRDSDHHQPGRHRRDRPHRQRDRQPDRGQ